MRGYVLLFGSCCALVAASPLHAGGTSATLEVSFTILPGCVVGTAPLAFAASAGAHAEAEAAIDIRCSAETGVAVSLDDGRNAAGTARRLTSGMGVAVPYAIYSDPARTRRWDERPILADAAPDRPLRLVAYGRIERGDTGVPPGDYRDSVTITVAF